MEEELIKVGYAINKVKGLTNSIPCDRDQYIIELFSKLSKNTSEIQKCLNYSLSMFFTVKWSHQLNYVQKVKELLESFDNCTNKRHKIIHAIHIHCLIHYNNDYIDKAKFHKYEDVSVKLLQRWDRFELLQDERLFRRYIPKIENSKLYVLLNSICYYCIQNKRHIVQHLLIYLLSDEQYDELSYPIKDTYGIFTGLDDKSLKDPIWYVWMLIIILVKDKQILKTDTSSCYVDQMVLNNLCIFKLCYSLQNKRKHSIVIFRLFNLYFNSKNLDQRQEEWSDDMLDTINKALVGDIKQKPVKKAVESHKSVEPETTQDKQCDMEYLKFVTYKNGALC
jgi:hypothetical protein